MFDKMKQLQAMKSQMEDAKARMNDITVRGEAEGVYVISNANRKVLEVNVPESLLESSKKDELQELVTLATNRALEQAERVFESEMRGMAGGMMSGLGL